LERTSAFCWPRTGAKNNGSWPLAKLSRRIVISQQLGGLVIEYVLDRRLPAAAAGL